MILRGCGSALVDAYFFKRLVSNRIVRYEVCPLVVKYTEYTRCDTWYNHRIQNVAHFWVSLLFLRLLKIKIPMFQSSGSHFAMHVSSQFRGELNKKAKNATAGLPVCSSMPQHLRGIVVCTYR